MFAHAELTMFIYVFIDLVGDAIDKVGPMNIGRQVVGITVATGADVGNDWLSIVEDQPALELGQLNITKVPG